MAWVLLPIYQKTISKGYAKYEARKITLEGLFKRSYGTLDAFNKRKF
jgi:hypothetical protein